MAEKYLFLKVRRRDRLGGPLAWLVVAITAPIVRLPVALVRGIANLFNPASTRDRRETEKLMRAAMCAYQTTPLAKDGGEELRNDVITMAYQMADAPEFPVSLIDALCALVDELRCAEGFCEVPELDLAALTPAEAIDDRNRLRQQLRRFEDYHKLMPIWRDKLAITIAGVLDYVPDQVFERAAALEGDGDDERRGLEVSILSLMRDPAEAIERLIATMHDKDVRDAGLYEGLRTQFYTNVLDASGIPIEKADQSTKREVMPTEARAAPHELADLYLKGTAFRALFDLSLPFALPLSARFEHTHIVGGTGHGKTQLLQLLLRDDLLKVKEGKGSVVVIDSQGDLIRTLLHRDLFSPISPDSLADQLVLIDPTDLAHPPALNLFDFGLKRLQGYDALEREKLLNGAIALYEYIFGALLGAELTQKQGVIFKYLARLMLAIPGATVHTLRELMEDPAAVAPYLPALEGSARYFFETQFAASTFDDTRRQIQNRLWGILSNPVLERMFSHRENKVDLYDAMNSGKVVVIHTAKDLLKKDGCQLLGRFFIALIAQATLERASIPQDRRCSTFVYVDEAHDYFDESIEDLLTQARKYRVGMVLAHQNLDQLSERLRAAVMSSTSIKLAGGMSAKDARALAHEMRCAPEYLQDARKSADHTTFALFVKHLTPQALHVQVPFGTLEAEPEMEEAEYQELLLHARARMSSEEGREAVSATHEQRKAGGGFEVAEWEGL
jgi:hypothetical protein